MPAASLFQAGLLKFLGIEEKTCDVLTGEFCNEEQLPGCDWSSGAVSALCLEFLCRKRQLTSLSGKSPEEIGKLLEAPLPFGAQGLRDLQRRDVLPCSCAAKWNFGIEWCQWLLVLTHPSLDCASMVPGHQETTPWTQRRSLNSQNANCRNRTGTWTTVAVLVAALQHRKTLESIAGSKVL